MTPAPPSSPPPPRDYGVKMNTYLKQSEEYAVRTGLELKVAAQQLAQRAGCERNAGIAG